MHSKPQGKRPRTVPNRPSTPSHLPAAPLCSTTAHLGHTRVYARWLLLLRAVVNIASLVSVVWLRLFLFWWRVGA